VTLTESAVSPTCVAFDYPRNSAGQMIHVEGNAGRNRIEQPEINNWYLGLFKNTMVREQFGLRLKF
jgi:hypothetical protein